MKMVSLRYSIIEIEIFQQQFPISENNKRNSQKTLISEMWHYYAQSGCIPLLIQFYDYTFIMTKYNQSSTQPIRRLVINVFRLRSIIGGTTNLIFSFYSSFSLLKNIKTIFCSIPILNFK